jgi:hypothetical protein
MLIKHGIDDMNKCFVTIKQTMPAGQQVAFQPAFTLVFASITLPSGARNSSDSTTGAIRSFYPVSDFYS